MVSTPVIYVITWITTHLPIPKGWKAELAWIVIVVVVGSLVLVLVVLGSSSVVR